MLIAASGMLASMLVLSVFGVYSYLCRRCGVPRDRIRGTPLIWIYMNWKQFNRANNLLGWAVFAIATLTYLLTIGPSASLWDCAEFIACDYKLEIGHPLEPPSICWSTTSSPTLAEAPSVLL